MRLGTTYERYNYIYASFGRYKALKWIWSIRIANMYNASKAQETRAWGGFRDFLWDECGTELIRVQRFVNTCIQIYVYACHLAL